MLMLNSAEFVALCRAQVVLLTQALGASLSVVYLTQELADGAETRLIPVIAYPETAIDWQAQGVARPIASTIDTVKPALWLLAEPHLSLPQAKTLPTPTPNESTVRAEVAPDRLATDGSSRAHSDHDSQSKHSQSKHSQSEHSQSEHSQSERTALVPERRIVLPLMHEEAVLGLLVTERSDRPWTEFEQAQIHQIADTLAIARILDQRHQWLEQDQRQQLQAQQHDLLDNLLHQFRNSLTTLQTFGKLILKRLLPEDANRDIAASLVRETARLRDLAEQLELAVAGHALKMPPLALLPANDAAASDAAASEERSPEQHGDRSSDQRKSDRQEPPLPLLPAASLLPETASLPCPLPTVLEPLLASASAIAQERALTLITDIPDDLPSVSAKRQLLQEVLSNAIDNALKYTPAGGQVLVQARLKGGKRQAGRQVVEIAITDTGPGIPAKDLPHIFERRYRGVQAQTEIPGSGLGLAIARTLMTQMQGEICVFSPARVSSVDQRITDALTMQGQGTTVVVRLAIASP